MVDLNVTPISQKIPTQLSKTKPTEPVAEKDGFGQWLSQSLNEVSQLQQSADIASRKLITGESKDIHGTMIAMQKASIAFELTMEIRNKVVAAYDEVKRMQF